MIKRMLKDDSAVSETLGYILLFGIALTAIAIILLVGNSIIDNERSNDNFQNIIQSFSIIQSDLTQVALEKTPIETTMMHMEGGTLSANSTMGHIIVGYNNSTVPQHSVRDITTGGVMFSSDKDALKTISMDYGGIWQKSGEDLSDTMISEPRFYITPNTDTLVLNVMRLHTMPGNQTLASSGEGTLNIGLMYDNTSVYSEDLDTGTVTLTLDTNYPNAWKRYLNDTLGSQTLDDGTPIVVHTTINANQIVTTISPVSEVIISEHNVNLSIGGLYGG